MTDNKKGGLRYTLSILALCILAGTGINWLINFRAPEVRDLTAKVEDNTRLLTAKDTEIEELKASLDEQRAILKRARDIIEPIMQADMAACRNVEGGEVHTRFGAPANGWVRARKVVSLMPAPPICVIEEGAE